jgi:hypothetical protein
LLLLDRNHLHPAGLFYPPSVPVERSVTQRTVTRA